MCCVATMSADSAVSVDGGIQLAEFVANAPLSRGSIFELIKALGIATTKGPGPGGKGRVAWQCCYYPRWDHPRWDHLHQNGKKLLVAN